MLVPFLLGRWPPPAARCPPYRVGSPRGGNAPDGRRRLLNDLRLPATYCGGLFDPLTNYCTMYKWCLLKFQYCLPPPPFQVQNHACSLPFVRFWVPPSRSRRHLYMPPEYNASFWGKHDARKAFFACFPQNGVLHYFLMNSWPAEKCPFSRTKVFLQKYRKKRDDRKSFCQISAKNFGRNSCRKAFWPTTSVFLLKHTRA